MVYYCCVNGCKNNSKLRKTDPNYTVSFHAFPVNSELRSKWLRAIGRPTWQPTNHSRICSAHFSYDQISHETCRARIKEDACPVNALPLNSNFEASDLDVCRICLASDLKMHSLQEGMLKTCMESIGGLNEDIEGLPQFVCYECAAYLIQFYHLIEKSRIAQATLLDIFAQHGQITKRLIKRQDRKQLNLISSLNYCKQSNIYDYTYNYEDGTSCLVKSECNISNSFKPRLNFKEDNKDFTVDKEDINPNNMAIKEKDKLESTASDHDHCYVDEKIKIQNSSETEFNMDCMDDDTVWEVHHEETVVNVRHKRKRNKVIVNDETVEKKTKIKNANGLTPDEVNMQDYFDIVKLSLQEQIDEWQKFVARRHFNSEATYRCETCSRLFDHIDNYRMHRSNHDPSQGQAECPVCKLRFKNEVLVRSHQNRTHVKMFYCKSCPKVYNNVAVAKKHHSLHHGRVYTCAACPFASVHASSVREHARTAHARDTTCVTCGRACLSARGLLLHHAAAHRDRQETEGNPKFRCDQCNINFISEGARRVHILTSSHHKKKPNLCETSPADPSLKTTCSKCGVECQSLKELIKHIRSEHRRSPQKRTQWSLPGDSYPTQCEHCGETLNSRKEHWWHVRRQHPKERHTYQPVITAVCETCGKGFQNYNKLQLHELRHAAPRVSCPVCARVFYDKFQLKKHASAHTAARPHACPHCPLAFKQRAGLQRHARVHTAARPYECTMCGKKFKYSTSVNLHVRTVHYKLPHPPRKKRNRPRDISSNTNNDNE